MMIGYGMAIPLQAVLGGGGSDAENLLTNSWNFDSTFWKGAAVG